MIKGIVPVSAKAIRAQDFEELYVRNIEQKHGITNEQKRNYLIYLISFLCLLRINETLELRKCDIVWHNCIVIFILRG